MDSGGTSLSEQSSSVSPTETSGRTYTSTTAFSTTFPTSTCFSESVESQSGATTSSSNTDSLTNISQPTQSKFTSPNHSRSLSPQQKMPHLFDDEDTKCKPILSKSNPYDYEASTSNVPRRVKRVSFEDTPKPLLSSKNISKEPASSHEKLNELRPSRGNKAEPDSPTYKKFNRTQDQDLKDIGNSHSSSPATSRQALAKKAMRSPKTSSIDDATSTHDGQSRPSFARDRRSVNDPVRKLSNSFTSSKSNVPGVSRTVPLSKDPNQIASAHGALPDKKEEPNSERDYRQSRKVLPQKSEELFVGPSIPRKLSSTSSLGSKRDDKAKDNTIGITASPETPHLYGTDIRPVGSNEPSSIDKTLAKNKGIEPRKRTVKNPKILDSSITSRSNSDDNVEKSADITLDKSMSLTPRKTRSPHTFTGSRTDPAQIAHPPGRRKTPRYTSDHSNKAGIKPAKLRVSQTDTSSSSSRTENRGSTSHSPSSGKTSANRAGFSKSAPIDRRSSKLLKGVSKDDKDKDEEMLKFEPGLSSADPNSSRESLKISAKDSDISSGANSSHSSDLKSIDDSNSSGESFHSNPKILSKPKEMINPHPDIDSVADSSDTSRKVGRKDRESQISSQPRYVTPREVGATVSEQPLDNLESRKSLPSAHPILSQNSSKRPKKEILQGSRLESDSSKSKISSETSVPNIRKISSSQKQVQVPSQKKALTSSLAQNSPYEDLIDESKTLKMKEPNKNSNVMLNDRKIVTGKGFSRRKDGSSLSTPAHSGEKIEGESASFTMMTSKKTKIVVPKPVSSSIAPTSKSKRVNQIQNTLQTIRDVKQGDIPKVKSPLMKVMSPKQTGRLKGKSNSPSLKVRNVTAPKVGSSVRSKSSDKPAKPDEVKTIPTYPHFRGTTSPKLVLSSPSSLKADISPSASNVSSSSLTSKPKSSQLRFKPRRISPLDGPEKLSSISEMSNKNPIGNTFESSSSLTSKPKSSQPRFKPHRSSPLDGPEKLSSISEISNKNPIGNTFESRLPSTSKAAGYPRKISHTITARAKPASPHISNSRLNGTAKRASDPTMTESNKLVKNENSHPNPSVGFRSRWSPQESRSQPPDIPYEVDRPKSASPRMKFKPKSSSATNCSTESSRVYPPNSSLPFQTLSNDSFASTFKPRWNSTKKCATSPDYQTVSEKPRLQPSQPQFKPRWDTTNTMGAKQQRNSFTGMKRSSSNAEQSSATRKTPPRTPKMKTIIPTLRKPSPQYRTRLSPYQTNPGSSTSSRIRPSSLSVGETRSLGDRLSPSRLKLTLRTPSPISSRKPWDSSITTPEPRYIRSTTPSPIPSPISIPRARPSGSTRFCSSCSPVGCSPGPVLYTYNSFVTEPRVRYRSLDDRPPWNSNTKTPPLFSVMSPLDDITHRRMSIRTAVRQVRSPIYRRKRFASAPAQTRLSPYRDFRSPG